MSVKLFFFDLETTGLSHVSHGIHQIAVRLYVDYKLVKEFNCDVQPFPNDVIDEKALEIGGKTIDSLKIDHIAPNKLYTSFSNLLNANCDKFSKQDKIFLCGYNNASFDNQFLRSFFTKSGDKYFGSYFWSSPIDVFVLASQYLLNQRHEMPDFKLETVARKLGIDVQSQDLHNAFYDLYLTESIYEIVTGVRLERS